MYLRFSTWNVRTLYRVGSLTAVAREFCFVDVQKVRWETGGIERAEDYIIFYGKGNGVHQLGAGFFLH
jgi:hypothetical protein